MESRRTVRGAGPVLRPGGLMLASRGPEAWPPVHRGPIRVWLGSSELTPPINLRLQPSAGSWYRQLPEGGYPRAGAGGRQARIGTQWCIGGPIKYLPKSFHIGIPRGRGEVSARTVDHNDPTDHPLSEGMTRRGKGGEAA